MVVSLNRILEANLSQKEGFNVAIKQGLFFHVECCCHATSIQVMATVDVWEFPSHDSQLLCAGTLSDTELHRTKSPLLSSSATQINKVTAWNALGKRVGNHLKDFCQS